jgi:Cellulose binding domain
MKYGTKNSFLFFLLIASCSSLQIASSNLQQPLSATFEIDPQSIKDTQYQAKINLVNNGSKLCNGWQLEFNFSSADQVIKKISSGVTTVGASNPITITNIPQHIRTAAGGRRTIRITVQKNYDTIATAPTITATADQSKDCSSSLTVGAM